MNHDNFRTSHPRNSYNRTQHKSFRKICTLPHIGHYSLESWKLPSWINKNSPQIPSEFWYIFNPVCMTSNKCKTRNARSLKREFNEYNYINQYSIQTERNDFIYMYVPTVSLSRVTYIWRLIFFLVGDSYLDTMFSFESIQTIPRFITFKNYMLFLLSSERFLWFK